LAIVNGSAPFAARPTTLTTITELDVRRIIGKLVEFPRRRNSDPVALWIEALSVARLGLRDPTEVEAMYDGDVDGFTETLPRYRAALAAARSVDFDEQVVRAIEILLTEPEARAAAQHACRVLLVDEFQDLTPAHLLLVRLLAGPDGCVFGVGDDDQTIYGFNGADPQWLIDFGRHFPGAGDHPLEVNYRCPADVVAAASMLLQHNARRVPKQIRAASAARGFSVDVGDDAVATTSAVVSHALSAGCAPGDIAVLTRVNSLLAPVQVALGLVGVASTGGVGVESPDRVEPAAFWQQGGRDHVQDRLRGMPVADRRRHARGLVEQDVLGRRRRADDPAVDRDDRLVRIDLHPELRGLAVDGHPSVGDEHLACPPRRHARRSEDLLESLDRHQSEASAAESRPAIGESVTRRSIARPA